MLARICFSTLLSLALSLPLLGQAGACSDHGEKRVSALPSPTALDGTEFRELSPEQQNFNKLVDAYFNDAFKNNPSWATEVGIHDFDGQLESFDQAYLKQRAAALETYQQDIEKIDVGKLDKFSSLDREMLLSDIQAHLLELEDIQNWRHNPDVYSSAIGSSIFNLIKREFASPEERLKSVIARERLVPSILASARANLEGTPKIYTEVALEQLPGSIDFFTHAVPESFALVKDEKLKAEFTEANQRVIDELNSYADYLKKEVLPKSIDRFAIGKENYKRKLLYEEMVDEPLDKLLSLGYDELHRLQKDFASAARQIDKSKAPREVYAKISKDHPQPGELLSSVKGVLNNLRDTCNNKSIVTIPSEDELKVEETPPFMRALTFASMNAPGPFERKAKEAYYHVTLPEKDWDAKKTEEHMRFFCRGDLINTSVHEAYPGHYVQGLWMKQAPSKTRKLLSCGTNSEGWAHYCEEMMADDALAAGDSKLKLVQLHDALVRVCRYIVGIRMHTDNMSLNEAISFFEKEGCQEHANAEREAKRGTMDPTYLVYTLGKLQILQLRDDYKKAKGDQFNLKEFHNNFLAQGAPPLKLVRQALLGQDPAVK